MKLNRYLRARSLLVHASMWHHRTMHFELFDRHATLRVVIESVLEGRLGRAVFDDASDPKVARLDLGCYAVFGGDSNHPAAARLVESVSAPRELLPPDDQGWRDLLQKMHGRKLSDRTMRTFSAHTLDRDRLRTMSSRIAAGYRLGRIDEGRAGRLDESLEPHAMQVFESSAQFARHGIGFCAERDGAMASAATSYAISSRRVEIAVATAADHRGKGLARSVAAALALHCLQNDRIPEWSAGNPVSKRLALDLGYLPARLCDIFDLE